MPNRLKREGDYLLIFRHDSSGGAVFGSDAEARSTGTPDSDKFSALNALEHFRRPDGNFQFKLIYPEHTDLFNIWKQQNNFAAFDVGNYIRNGTFAGGLGVVEHNYTTGSWSTIEKENPGSSTYVLEHQPGAAQQYRMDIPQSRLKPNTTYTLTAWVGFEDTADRNKGIFHARWYDGSSNPIASSSLESGDVYLANGNSYVMDGITWERRYYRFTTPSSLADTTMFWYLGYSSASGGSLAGKRYFTNIQVLDKPLIYNYMGDYTATAGGVVGYEAIDINATGNNWGGLEYATRSETLADGSVGVSDWWFSIGCQSLYATDDYPGPNSNKVQVVELWVYAPLGAAVKQGELYASHFSESSSNQNVIYVNGVATDHIGGNQQRRGLPICYLNDNSMITGSATTRSDGKMFIIRWDSNLTHLTTHDFDMTTSTGRTNFAQELTNIAGNQELVAIVSAGNVISDANVDSTMVGFGAIEWKGTDFYSKYDYGYAAIVRADMGFVSERSQFNHPLEEESHTNCVFNTIDDLGDVGFGLPLLEDINTDGTSADIDITDVMEDQYVLLTCLGKRSYADAAAGTSRWCTIYWKNGSTVISQNAIRIESTTLTKYQLYAKRPAGVDGMHIWSSGCSEGFRSIYEATYEIPATDRIATSRNGISCNHISITPLSGTPWEPDSWYRMTTSNSNLLAGLPISQDEPTSVYWGDKTLTSNNEKCYVDKTNDAGSTTAIIPFPGKGVPYHVSWWVNYKQTPTAKNLFFQLRGRDSGGSYVNTIVDAVNGATGSTYPRLQYVDGTQLSENLDKWILLSGWILPNTWSQTQCRSFAAQRSYFFGTVDNIGDFDGFSNGIGIHNSTSETTYSGFFQVPDDVTEIQLRLDDRDNAGGTTEYCTALPCISQVKVAAADIDRAYVEEMQEFWEWRYRNHDNEDTGTYGTLGLTMKPNDEIEFYIRGDGNPDASRWQYLIDGNSPRCHVALTTTDSWSLSSQWDLWVDGIKTVNGSAFNPLDGFMHHVRLVNKSSSDLLIETIGCRYNFVELNTMSMWGMKGTFDGSPRSWEMNDGPDATFFQDRYNKTNITLVNPTNKNWYRTEVLV
ncbi:hinge connector of long tail fiber protein distal connector [Vibrio phage D479]